MTTPRELTKDEVDEVSKILKAFISDMLSDPRSLTVRKDMKDLNEMLIGYLDRLIFTIRQREKEVSELKGQLQNDAANKMPTSFVKMTWGCGHEGGASCLQCFEAKCREVSILTSELAKQKEEVERMTNEIWKNRSYYDANDELTYCNFCGSNAIGKHTDAAIHHKDGCIIAKIEEAL